MIDERLQQIFDSKKNPIAKAILQDLFESDEFRLNMCKRLKQLVSKKRGQLGYNMSEGGWTWNDDELDEGIGSALMGLVKTAAAKSVATGLGVSPSTIHGFTKALSNGPKKVVAPHKTAAKSVHTKPAGASLHTAPIHHMVIPSDVHSAIGKHRGEHEQHLNDFVNHYNKGMEAKAKGDKNLAYLHFRNRNRAMVRYQTTAPAAHRKYLNVNKVQQMLSVKE